jgi:ataxin-10
MRNNLENQAIIKQMDPVGVLSDSGEVLPVPEKMKRQSQGATVAQLP